MSGRRKIANSYMKKASIAELKNSLSRYLDHVRDGGQVAPASLPFVTLDDRQAEAAMAEGFPVLTA